MDLSGDRPSGAGRDAGGERLPPSPPVVRHFTASAFVTHQHRALLILHSTKRLWLPPGGHVEPDEAPCAAAVREVWEETGLRVEITSERVPSYALHAAPRPEASFEVEVEPGHVHLDLIYFARPVPGAPVGPLRPNDEVASARWWARRELQAGDRNGPLRPDVAALALLALSASESTASPR